jgi:hypothetical protein
MRWLPDAAFDRYGCLAIVHVIPIAVTASRRLRYTNFVRTISLRRQRRAVYGPLLAAFAAFVYPVFASGQELTKKPSDPPAFRLPDGTIVFNATPGTDPIPNSVRLSAKDYAALVEKAERATREQKPLIPSECRIGVSVELRNERSIAVVTLNYRFKTTLPQTTVLLGGRELFPTSARFANGELPVLMATNAGFAVVADRAGVHELTLTADAAIAMRPNRSETGFEFGLPGSVVTSLRMAPPRTNTKSVTVTSRSQAGPAESQSVEFPRLAQTQDRPYGLPLGAIVQLELSWDAPNAQAILTNTAEFDVAVRIEDTVIETVSRIRLRGPQRIWSLVLPIDARLAVERMTGLKTTLAEPSATAVSSGTAANPLWTVTVPDSGEWLVTATQRRIRPTKAAPDYIGPYPIGPVSVQNVLRQSGTIRCYAPAGIRVTASHGSEIRAADPTPAAAGEESPSVAYFVRTPPAAPPNAPSPPLLTLDVRPAPPIVQVRPTHRLRLTEAGWQLRSDLRITPVHQELTQLAIDVPIGWGAIDVTPADLVEGVQPVGDTGATRRLAVRLIAPRKEAFDLVLEAIIPLPAGPRPQPMMIPLPRVVGTVERDARLTAVVPDGWEIKGTVRDGDPATPGSRLVELTGESATSRGPTTTVSAVCDRVAAVVNLTWQPYRPELPATITTDVTIGERQMIVSETIQFAIPNPIERTIRLRGPVNAAGLRSNPPLTPTGAGEYALLLPADKKTVVQTLSYAMPLPIKSGESDVAIGMYWSEDATQTHATVRVWGPSGKRIAQVVGPWRDEPAALPTDRDAWPWRSVSTVRHAGEDVPSLVLSLADSGNYSPPDTVVERAEYFGILDTGAGARLKARFWLSRWPGSGLDIDLPSESSWECYVDGRRVQPLPREGLPREDGSVRIPMPESKPGRSPVIVEIRCTSSDPSLEKGMALPTIARSMNRTPPQWNVWGPRSRVALDLSGAFSPDLQWTWRGLPTGFSPVPSTRNTGSPGDDGDMISSGLTPLFAGQLHSTTGTMPHIVTVPSPVWILCWSAIAAFFGWIAIQIGQSRIGYVAAGVGLLFAVALMFRPQITAQALAAMQPGVAAFGLAMAVVMLRRAWLSRSGRRLPAFSSLSASSLSTPSRPSDQLAESRLRATPIPLAPQSGAAT